MESQNLRGTPETKPWRKRTITTQQEAAVREAQALDKWFFETHPHLVSYWRFYVEGEFGVLELPDPPPGWHKAIHVTRRTKCNTHRREHFDVRIPNWA
jgi:hypothetical protein